MDPKTLQFIADALLGLHIQIAQFNDALQASQVRVSELETANRVLEAKVKDLKKVAPKGQ